MMSILIVCCRCLLPFSKEYYETVLIKFNVKHITHKVDRGKAVMGNIKLPSRLIMGKTLKIFSEVAGAISPTAC